MPRPRLVTCDIDSTLADTHIRAAAMINRDDRSATDWTAYAQACASDSPTDVIALLSALCMSQTIALVTARPPESYPQTVAWLHRYRVPFDLLFMCPSTVKDPTGWKVDTIARLHAEDGGVAFHVDDWWAVGQRLREEHNIPTIVVRVYAPAHIEPAF
jgi:hypothetical protein